MYLSQIIYMRLEIFDHVYECITILLVWRNEWNKVGLISFPSPKKCAKSLSTFFSRKYAQDSDLAHFLGDGAKLKKSKIKPPSKSFF